MLPLAPTGTWQTHRRRLRPGPESRSRRVAAAAARGRRSRPSESALAYLRPTPFFGHLRCCPRLLPSFSVALTHACLPARPCGVLLRPRAIEPGTKPPARARAKVKAKPRAVAAPVALSLFVGDGVEISITASDLSTVNQAVAVRPHQILCSYCHRHRRHTRKLAAILTTAAVTASLCAGCARRARSARVFRSRVRGMGGAVQARGAQGRARARRRRGRPCCGALADTHTCIHVA
eukprot:COSAG06_NODE_18203_length_898_cov_17.848561_1_plen_235_part_00